MWIVTTDHGGQDKIKTKCWGHITARFWSGGDALQRAERVRAREKERGGESTLREKREKG